MTLFFPSNPLLIDGSCGKSVPYVSTDLCRLVCIFAINKMPDYSSYITLKNNLDVPLICIDYGTDHGHWQLGPPLSIAVNSESDQLQIQNSAGEYLNTCDW